MVAAPFPFPVGKLLCCAWTLICDLHFMQLSLAHLLEYLMDRCHFVPYYRKNVNSILTKDNTSIAKSLFGFIAHTSLWRGHG